uniref:Uncharacterized protein n=1 Tax=Oryza sativa subsp. japonica TaxID=39947 RepID=Q5Z4B3_ORYSJ|nr:hypothetical protein [Oryza sativa Japonica Group]BAD62419.1 hypothetical protein [Oryza sativa Japonica Group]
MDGKRIGTGCLFPCHEQSMRKPLRKGKLPFVLVVGGRSIGANPDSSDLENLNSVAPLQLHMRLSWEIPKFESENGGCRLLRTSSTRRRVQPIRRNAQEERHAQATAPWRGGDVPAWKGEAALFFVIVASTSPS